MIYPKIPLAQTVIQLCKAKQIKHIVISPGSRSAPLTIGFTNDSYFKCYSIVDERCAAFYALGIAQSNTKPTALVCTSGSALLNYYPAIAEAFYSDIPVIILSADRPEYLLNIGDGQTINQKNVYNNHILYSANLKQDINHKKNTAANKELPIIKNVNHKPKHVLESQKNIQEYNEKEINIAINVSKHKKGPVHINIPFDEPLYQTVNALSAHPKNIKLDLKNSAVDETILNTCANIWNSAAKKMILVGVNYPHTISTEILEQLANDSSVIVLTETTSNLHHDNFFPSIDQLIAPLSDEEQNALQPEILVTFGGLIVSKKIKALLRKYKPKAHWHIDEHKANDTFFSLSQHIKTTPQKFFTSFLLKIKHYNNAKYNNAWSLVKAHRLKRHKDYVEKIPFSDFKVFSILLKAIPKNSILQVSNSSAIRYAQLFSMKKSIDVFCNRGTSGIDGSTSTAIGFSVTTEKQTTCITGDLSFFYDSNALWNNYIPHSFRLIVVNNTGGGIFRILPGHKNSENFNTYFETNHNLNAKKLCEMYNITYQAVENETELNICLKTFYKQSNTPKLLEVFTPKNLNDKILLEYFNYIN